MWNLRFLLILSKICFKEIHISTLIDGTIITYFACTKRVTNIQETSSFLYRMLTKRKSQFFYLLHHIFVCIFPGPCLRTWKLGIFAFQRKTVLIVQQLSVIGCDGKGISWRPVQKIENLVGSKFILFSSKISFSHWTNLLSFASILIQLSFRTSIRCLG